MKAITIRQPWTQCVVGGHKNVENRGRSVSYRGDIAIHAAKAHDPAGDVDPRVVRLWGRDPRVGMTLGAVLAVAELYDCHEAVDACMIEGSPCWPWGERLYRGKPAWHLMLRNVRRLDAPAYCKGALQVGWTVPDEVADGITADLAVQAGEPCGRCQAGPAVGVCCSSHRKALCHRCYRQTHFVERCGATCAACAREGLDPMARVR
jgi:hypothetical protein